MPKSKLEIIEFLLADVKTEMDNEKRYEKLLAEAEQKSMKAFGDKRSYYQYIGKNVQRNVRKSVIKDNLKMIRRLSLEIEKEL